MFEPRTVQPASICSSNQLACRVLFLVEGMFPEQRRVPEQKPFERTHNSAPVRPHFATIFRRLQPF